MSTIHNSYEYYEGNQSLLSMLNKKKTGNKLINQIISDNDAAFKKKMESMANFKDIFIVDMRGVSTMYANDGGVILVV